MVDLGLGVLDLDFGMISCDFCVVKSVDMLAALLGFAGFEVP